MQIADALRRAAKALEQRELEVALLELVAAWQQARLPRLAQFAQWVSARLPSEPITAQREWLERAGKKDSLALPGLLTTLTAPGFREAEDRAEQLMKWEDPRISAGLLAMLGSPRYRSSGAQYFYERVMKALTVQRDPRVPPALRTLAARYHEVITNSFGPKLAADLLKAADEMKVDDASEGELAPLIDALEPFFESERGDELRARGRGGELAAQERELRAKAMARPDDDALFLVWADVLTEQSDPRGELISLQLQEKQRGLAPEQLHQLRELQSKQRDRLLGAIAPDVVNAVFERGLAVHVELGRRWTPPSPGAAEWASVRGVTMRDDYQRADEWAPLLTSLPKLQSLLRVMPEVLEALGGRALEHVLLRGDDEPEALSVPVKHLAARDEGFAGMLRRHVGPSITFESSRPEAAVELLENSVARRVRFVDGVHYLEPMGWYGWCCEFDTLEKILTVRARFPGAADLARLDTWLTALRRLKPVELILDDSPQRDALYLPLTRPTFDLERASAAAGVKVSRTAR